MSPTQRIISYALGAIGALIGSVLGHYIFLWIVGQGFYGLAIPGAFVGVGAGICVRHRSWIFAGFCAGWAALVGIFTEWKFAPFSADDSFGYFIRNLGDLTPITKIMIVIGAALGFWFGLGGIRTARQAMKERLIKAAQKDN